MALIRGKLAFKAINKSDNSFDLKGMIGPSFFNTGESVVMINNQEVLPGESFSIDLSGIVMEGTVNIEFVLEAGKNNLLMINYVHYVGPFTNPATGLPIEQSVSNC